VRLAREAGEAAPPVSLHGDAKARLAEILGQHLGEAAIVLD